VADFVEKPGEGTGLKDRQKVEKPRRFKVLLHNDDYTSMDFVVEILEGVFRKSRADAVDIMLNVHQRGHGLAGVYIKAVAEQKIDATHARAQEQGFPLRCSMEPE